MVKQEMIFRPVHWTTFTVITLNRESNFSCREKNHFLFQWNFRRYQNYRYILGCDVREKHRRLLERWCRSRIVRYMDRFHKIHYIKWKWKATWRIYMVCEATDKEAHDIQARLPVPEKWKDMSEASKRKEKQNWAIEKPKLDNARRLRGIYFIDPASAEFKETLQNAQRKLEVPMPAAMPCKTRGKEYRETRVCARQKYVCIVEADESTRKRMEGTLPKDHEDHTAGKGMNS